MKSIRATVYLAILVIVVIPYCFLVLASALLPRLPRYRIIAGWPQFATWLAKHLLGIRYEVRGIENIPPDPCVILSKHQSAWETIAFTSIFPPHVYVLKRELLWLPFLGWGLAVMSPIAINRANRKEAMAQLIAQGADRLKQGFCIMIFPEGTRTAVGTRGTYRRGGAVLALNTGARILPVAHNAGLLWPRNSYIKNPGLVTVVIGKPIDTAGREADDLMRETEHWIETQMQILTPSTARDKSNIAPT